MTYEQFHVFNSPPWLQRARGALFQGALGKDLDTVLDRIRQAAIAALPDSTNSAGVLTFTPPDALKYIGADRVLPRISGETDVAYASRLQDAWATWDLAGGYLGMLRALIRAGFPAGSTGTNVVQQIGRYGYLTGDGLTGTVTYSTHPPMIFDDTPGSWNQFMLIFNTDVPALTVGSRLAEVLNQTVRTWKPAKARYLGATIVLSQPLWGWPPTAAWGSGGRVWGGGSVRFIPPT